MMRAFLTSDFAKFLLCMAPVAITFAGLWSMTP